MNFLTEEWRARRVTRKMGLQDKGGVEIKFADGKGYSEMRHLHINFPDAVKNMFCTARLRLGTQDGKIILWCWRCELVIGTFTEEESFDKKFFRQMGIRAEKF